jgi:hypothetical protein
MWQDKKFIIIASLLVVLIAAVGTLGGLALSRQNDNRPDQLQAARMQLLEKAANILQNNNNLTPEQREQKVDNVLDNYLQKLVEEGKITQEEADQFKAWWDSRPNIPGIFKQLEQSGTNFLGMMPMGQGGATFGFGGGK